MDRTGLHVTAPLFAFLVCTSSATNLITQQASNVVAEIVRETSKMSGNNMLLAYVDFSPQNGQWSNEYVLSRLSFHSVPYIYFKVRGNGTTPPKTSHGNQHSVNILYAVHYSENDPNAIFSALQRLCGSRRMSDAQFLFISTSSEEQQPLLISDRAFNVIKLKAELTFKLSATGATKLTVHSYCHYCLIRQRVARFYEYDGNAAQLKIAKMYSGEIFPDFTGNLYGLSLSAIHSFIWKRFPVVAKLPTYNTGLRALRLMAERMNFTVESEQIAASNYSDQYATEILNRTLTIGIGFIPRRFMPNSQLEMSRPYRRDWSSMLLKRANKRHSWIRVFVVNGFTFQALNFCLLNFISFAILALHLRESSHEGIFHVL